VHKLPSLTSQKVVKYWKEKDLYWYRSKGSHRVYYNSENKRRVIIPYHKKNLPKSTLMEILKQAGISKEELK